MKKRTSKSSKRKLRAARNHYINTVDSLTLAKTTVQCGEPACQTNVPVAKFRCDEGSRHFLRNKLFRALDCFCGESRRRTKENQLSPRNLKLWQKRLTNKTPKSTRFLRRFSNWSNNSRMLGQV